MSEVIYWTPHRILSYNRMLNFVVSMRGAGKTFGALQYVFNKCQKHGCEFVYLRRSEEEIRRVKGQLFAALQAQGAVQAELQVRRNTILEETEPASKNSRKKVRGYYMPLSLSAQYKSSSFPRVSYIIFDEFIAEDGRYLADETQKFTSILSTICRARPNVKVIFLGNLISSYNPYFMRLRELVRSDEYGIRKVRASHGTAVIENYQAQGVRDLYKKTQLSNVLATFGQDDYVIDNKSIADSEEGVIEEPEERMIRSSFIIEGNNYVISQFRRGLYVFKGRQKGAERVNLDKCFKNGMVNGFTRNMSVELIKDFATLGKVFYQNAGVKKICEQLIYS